MATIVKNLLRNYHKLDQDFKFDLGNALNELPFDGLELYIAQKTIDGYSLNETAKLLRLPQSTVNYKLNKISQKISDFLGGVYSDSSILQYTQDKLDRPLTEKEKRFCWQVIKLHGRKSNKLLNIFNIK